MTRQELMTVGLVALGALAAVLFVLSSGQIAENARLQNSIESAQQDSERVRSLATEAIATAEVIASEAAEQAAQVVAQQATDVRGTSVALDTDMQQREESARAILAEAQADATNVRATANAEIEAAAAELEDAKNTVNMRATSASATIAAIEESAEQEADAAHATLDAVEAEADAQAEAADATIAALEDGARADDVAAQATISALDGMAATLSVGATRAAEDAESSMQAMEQRLATVEAELSVTEATAEPTASRTPRATQTAQAASPTRTPRATQALQAPTPTRTPQTADDGIDIGRVVTARSVDSRGCPRQPAQEFTTEDDVIYVVAEASDIPEGTGVFVRWYFEGEPYEDAPEIVADQDYEDICVSFALELDGATEFTPGEYRAQFVINGNLDGSTTFTIKDI